MADVTELNCWPCCIDAIDWSQDGIMAVASDERVELLVIHAQSLPEWQIDANSAKFPHDTNNTSADREQDAGQWQHVSLQVPWFSNDELPIKDPGPLPTYSIGEEISTSSPTAIAWSAPGLAKHNRCALAVLTSNLVLSIWSAVRMPNEESSWNRNLIINDALKTFFLGNDTAGTSHITSDSNEELRLRTRIRAFSWAPDFPDSPHTLGTRISYGPHMVAVSNDDNQIVFVAINSPTSTFGAQQKWTAEVLSCFSLNLDPSTIFSEPSFFDDLMKQQRFIPHVAWSPWVTRGSSYRSVIAYATNEDVRTRTITYTDDGIKLGDEITHPGIEVRYDGMMKWCHIVEDDKLMLALFAHSGLIYVEISPDDASFGRQSTHDLNGRWDEASGAIWDCVQNSTPRLHFASMLSTLNSATAVVEVSSGELKDSTTPSWRDRIENSLVLFSVKNDLKGNGKVKVWGLTGSPLGDFVATAHSTHPSDMIEYGPPAERRGTVAISALRQYSTIRQGFASRSVSAEGVLFTLRKLVENTVEDTEHIPQFTGEMTEKLLKAYGPVSKLVESVKGAGIFPDNMDFKPLVKHFKATAFFDEDSLKSRYQILVERACNVKDKHIIDRTVIAYNLTEAVQKLPAKLLKTTFSREILAMQTEVFNMIGAVLGENPQTGLDEILNDGWKDRCDFCEAPIPLTDDFTEGKCNNGHPFVRCGLTFLPIQAPGISKYCGICDTPFFSDEFIEVQEEDDEEDDLGTDGEERVEGQEKSTHGGVTEDIVMGETWEEEGSASKRPVTLAKLLFQACDVCIYCGGKFVTK